MSGFLQPCDSHEEREKGPKSSETARQDSHPPHSLPLNVTSPPEEVERSRGRYQCCRDEEKVIYNHANEASYHVDDDVACGKM